MSRREPNWDELRTFLEVARDMSLSGAARRLGLTQPTVGRHIDALEDALGATLFTRSPRGLTPTAAATALVPHAEAMGAAAAALARSASSAAAVDRGVVRVTASDIMGAEALPAIFAGFRARNPGVAIELAVTNRNQDLARGDADIAVRMIRPTQSGLVARRIGVTRIRLYAHRDYVARFGEPRSLADLRQHCFIGFDRDNQTFRSAGSLAKALTREDFGFRCDSDLAQLAALRAGVGVGGCQDMIARRTPELVPVLPNAFQMMLEIWLVMHRDLKAAPRVRLLFDWLAAGLTDYVKGRTQRDASFIIPGGPKV
jgi:DNA-binding transcriptional LysR family regulator